MPYTQIKPEQIKVYPLALRKSKSDIKKIAVNPDEPPPPAPEIAETVKNAADSRAPDGPGSTRTCA